MIRLSPWIALAAVLACSGPLFGQDSLPIRLSVDPSSVVTIPLALPADAGSYARGKHGVEYRIQPGTGFRLLGRATGRLELGPDELAILPVSLSVASDVTAGEHLAVSARFEWESGTDSTAVTVHVAERAGLTLSLRPDQADARLGEPLAVSFELANTGNASDSVRLVVDTRLGTVTDSPAVVLLGPFETVTGEFHVRPEERALAGTVEGILVTAEGRHTAAHDRIELPVTRGDGLFESWARIPTSVFVGTSLYPGNDTRAATPAYGFESAGMVRPGIRLAVSAHSAPADVSAFAFRGFQMGPRFLAELSTARFDAAAGQLYTSTSPVLGYALQGAGGRIAVRSGRLAGMVHAAVPLDRGGNTVDGRQFGGEVGVNTTAGSFGVEGVSESRAAGLFSHARDLGSALLTYRTPGPSRHSLRAEVGWMHLEYPDLDEAADGPAVNARYTYSHGRNLVDVSARTRPMTPADVNLPPDELRAQATIGPWPSQGLLGEAYIVDHPRSAGLRADRIRGASLGGYFLSGTDRYELRLRTQSADGPVPFSSRGVEGVASTRIGAGYLDARVELGEMVTGDERGPLLQMNAGYNLRSSRGWGRAGLVYYDNPRVDGNLSLQVAGSYRIVGPAELYGSFTTSLTRFDLRRSTLAEVGLQWEVASGLSILAAFERAEGVYADASSRVSIGVRKGLPLPVPVRQPRSLQGVVFEDENGNGRFDAGEPLLDGVRLEMGSSLASTRNGRFAFRADVPRGPLVVDAASLGRAYLPVPIIPVSGTDLVQVAVHRPASLRVRPYLDANNNGIQDPTELPVVDAKILIRRTGGETWEVPIGPDGSGSLGAVRPGEFTVSIDPESLPRRAAAPEPVTLSVLGGDSIDLRIPVGRREVRFRDSE